MTTNNSLSIDEFWDKYSSQYYRDVDYFSNQQNTDLQLEISTVKSRTIKSYNYKDSLYFFKPAQYLKNINVKDYVNSNTYFIFECYDADKGNLLSLSSNESQLFITVDMKKSYPSYVEDKQKLEEFFEDLKRLPSSSSIHHSFVDFNIANKFQIKDVTNVYDKLLFYRRGVLILSSFKLINTDINNTNVYEYKGNDENLRPDGFKFVIVEIENENQTYAFTIDDEYKLYYKPNPDTIHFNSIGNWTYEVFLASLDAFYLNTRQTIHYTFVNYTNTDGVSYKVIKILNTNEISYKVYYLRTIITNNPLTQVGAGFLSYTLTNNVVPDRIELTEQYQKQLMDRVSFIEEEEIIDTNNKIKKCNNYNIFYYLLFVLIFIILISIILYHLYIC